MDSSQCVQQDYRHHAGIHPRRQNHCLLCFRILGGVQCDSDLYLHRHLECDQSVAELLVDGEVLHHHAADSWHRRSDFDDLDARQLFIDLEKRVEDPDDNGQIFTDK